MDNCYTLTIAEQTLQLHPSGAVFWEQQATLFVADLHLGKTTSFQRGGIPIPAGATTRSVDRLIECIEAMHPQRLVVLGDLVHARCSWDDELLDGLSRIGSNFKKGAFQLVEGNHDRGSRSRWKSLSIECYPAPHKDGPWTLLHDESTERPPGPESDVYYLAGHLHPAVKLSRPGESIRLRCFSWFNNCLTLAAFGSFTGSKSIDPHPGQQIFAIVENEVLPV
jgi:uncharacterized protein